MLRRWTFVAALAAVLCGWSGSHGALIVTTLGEEIICEIIEETDAYFIVDHHGYRRYVLKTQIRSLDRSGGAKVARTPRRYATLFGGYYITGHRIKPGPKNLRLAVGYPLNELMVIEGGFHYGKNRIESGHDMGRLLPGPFDWMGATVGVAWVIHQWPVRPVLEASLGYFRLDHTVDASEIEFQRAVREAIGWIEPGDTFDLQEKMERGIGVSLSAGAVYPFWERFAVTARASLLVINTGFDRVPYYNGVASLPSNHGLLMQMFQTNLGLQYYF